LTGSLCEVVTEAPTDFFHNIDYVVSSCIYLILSKYCNQQTPLERNGADRGQLRTVQDMCLRLIPREWGRGFDFAALLPAHDCACLVPKTQDSCADSIPKMSVRIGGFSSLRWKRAKGRRPSFITVYDPYHLLFVEYLKYMW